MSTVPPNLVGPILQSNLAQRQVSQVRDNERAQETNAKRQQSNLISEKDSTVETTDDDTQVYSDAEGGGSKGREFTEPEEPQDQPAESDSDADLEEGRLIDFEA